MLGNKIVTKNFHNHAQPLRNGAIFRILCHDENIQIKKIFYDQAP